MNDRTTRRGEEVRAHMAKKKAGVSGVGGGGLPPCNWSGGGTTCPLPLCLCLNDLRDLAGLQAARTHPNTLSLAADPGAHGHEVREPAPPRELVRVTDRVPDGGPFPADLAPLSHSRLLRRRNALGRRALLIARPPR